MLCVRMDWARARIGSASQQSKQPDEAPEQFAERVQRMTAQAIGLQSTKYTSSDKTALRKKFTPAASEHGGPHPRGTGAAGRTASGAPSRPGSVGPLPPDTPNGSSTWLLNDESTALPSDSRPNL